jgi:hypothetical protein
MKQVYTQQAVVRVWRNLKVLGNVPTQHFGHASVTVTGTTVPQRMQHISFWPKDGVNNRLGAFRSQEGSTTGEPDGDSSDGPMLDRVAEMNTLTAIRLEVGYCKTHGIVYPAVWDEALRLAHKSPLFALRQGQKRLEDVDGKVLTSNETGIEVPL